MFETPFEHLLDKDNRWVKLAAIVPWDSLANIYCHKLNASSGRKSVDVRLVIGALIVKHKLKLDDRGTVAMIQENMYIQYFCGYPTFNPSKPFDPSLFVDIRKRMGNKEFDAFNKVVIESSEEMKPKRKRIQSTRETEEPPVDKMQSPSKPSPQDISNKGTLKLDATIADQEITYPTDIKLLNTSREELERMIDLMYIMAGYSEKPRTYRRVARKSYLNIAKKKNKSSKVLRKGTKAQLQYVRRDLEYADNMYNILIKRNLHTIALEKRDRDLLNTIHEVYDQQLTMYKNKEHSHPNRIVNIYQPWVRPMPRGKDRNRTEFGAKINVSEVDGFCRINRIDWNNYNESVDLQKQVEEYKQLYGRYPKTVLADQIYLNRKNRKYMKERNIQIVGKPLGRPPKIEETAQQKWRKKKLAAQRNHIEAKFGQGKRGYDLNNIKARLPKTSESWIGAIFFVMNLTKLLKMAEKATEFCAIFLVNVINRNIEKLMLQLSPQTQILGC
jgi:hypothetical protein